MGIWSGSGSQTRYGRARSCSRRGGGGKGEVMMHNYCVRCAGGSEDILMRGGRRGGWLVI